MHQGRCALKGREVDVLYAVVLDGNGRTLTEIARTGNLPDGQHLADAANRQVQARRVPLPNGMAYAFERRRPARQDTLAPPSAVASSIFLRGARVSCLMRPP